MTGTFAVQPKNFDYYNHFVMCNYVCDDPKPVIQNAYTYEENGVLYCTSEIEQWGYRYTFCRNNPLMYTDQSGDFFWFALAVGTTFGIYQSLNQNGYFDRESVISGGIAGEIYAKSHDYKNSKSITNINSIKKTKT